MRRQPIFVRALLAFAIFWLAGSAFSDAAPGEIRGALASVHRDAAALSAPVALFGNAATSRKAHSPDWSSRLALPSRAFVPGSAQFRAPSAFATAGVRDRAERTVTYDATAPPRG